MVSTINYQGKKCIVIGAASGIGLSVVKILSEMGAEVYGIDLKEVPVPVEKYVQINMGDKTSIENGITQLPDKIDSIFSCVGVSE